MIFWKHLSIDHYALTIDAGAVIFHEKAEPGQKGRPTGSAGMNVSSIRAYFPLGDWPSLLLRSLWDFCHAMSFLVGICFVLTLIVIIIDIIIAITFGRSNPIGCTVIYFTYVWYVLT